MAASGASPELMKQLWDALGVHIASRLKQGKVGGLRFVYDSKLTSSTRPSLQSVVIPQFCRFALNDDGRVSFHLYEGFRSRHGVNERQVPTAKQVGEIYCVGCGWDSALPRNPLLISCT